MEGKRYSRRRYEEMRRRRRRQVRRQRLAVLGVCVVLIAAGAAAGVRVWRGHQEKVQAARQAEEVKKVIAAEYEKFI